MLGYAITATLPQLRAEAESLLIDACEMQERTGGTMDPATGHVTPTWTTYATSVCRVRPRDVDSRPRVGGEPLPESGYVVALPMSSQSPSVGHRFYITASMHDPSLVGRVLYVESPPPTGSQLVLRRVECTLTEPADR